MNASELLDRYEAMWRLTQDMLAAAKQANWDRLLELEQTRTAIVEQLKHEDKLQWQAAEASKKEALIHAILAADLETKLLTESWMGELNGVLGSRDTERKLKKAYGAA